MSKIYKAEKNSDQAIDSNRISDITWQGIRTQPLWFSNCNFQGSNMVWESVWPWLLNQYIPGCLKCDAQASKKCPVLKETQGSTLQASYFCCRQSQGKPLMGREVPLLPPEMTPRSISSICCLNSCRLSPNELPSANSRMCQDTTSLCQQNKSRQVSFCWKGPLSSISVGVCWS